MSITGIRNNLKSNKNVKLYSQLNTSFGYLKQCHLYNVTAIHLASCKTKADEAERDLQNSRRVGGTDCLEAVTKGRHSVCRRLQASRLLQPQMLH